jgi:hypothetical protein
MLLVSLFLAIAATVGWIALDVWVSLTTPMPTYEYHLLLAGGLILGAVTFVSEVAVWMLDHSRQLQDEKDRHEMQRKIESSSAAISGRTEVLAILQTLQLRGPASDAMPTTAKTVSTTSAQIDIENLEDLRNRLRKELARWPLISQEQLDEFATDIESLKGKVRICIVPTSDDYDCKPTIEAITNAIKAAGISLISNVGQFDHLKPYSPDIGGEMGLQIYSSIASSGFAEELAYAFEDDLPNAWQETSIVRDNAPPDDVIVLKIGRRWRTREEDGNGNSN